MTLGESVFPAGMASPSITRSAMACRLIAFDIACRTRMSLRGFLSSGLPAFDRMPGGRSRPWSTCRKMVRHDTVCSRRSVEVLRSLAMSAVGTCSMASTWPERSAAVRTGSLGRINSVTLSHGRRPPQ
ncbi:hypothetical protein D3C83_06380 [compost metagenome]